MGNNLLNLIRRDANFFINNDTGANTSIILSTPDCELYITLTVFFSHHSIDFDSFGNVAIDSENVHITFSERDALIKGFPLYENGKINLIDCFVKLSSPNRPSVVFTVERIKPNKGLGLITLILSIYEGKTPLELPNIN